MTNKRLSNNLNGITGITCVEYGIDKNNSNQTYGCFVIEPLNTGQGLTLGNSLRRTLLTDLTGFAISGVRINDLPHEFALIPGLREDCLEILLNLKEIIFKTAFDLSISKIQGFLNIKGPIILTAGLFKLPKNLIQILNPNQYLGTIVDSNEIYIEIDIESGKGYRLSEENQSQNSEKIVSPNKPTTLYIDASFMPVKKVDYKIRLINDTKGNIKESLTLDIWTNGSITPQRALQEAIKILLNLYYPLLVNSEFLALSDEYQSLKKKIY
uniref:RNA polymerase alpha subunit n=1 Tax=Neotessella volvocina TaxID=52559 RepID=A0A3G2R0T0_9STRA|nr:RNA polymerase alpha subunit [Neotessella volvocina]